MKSFSKQLNYIFLLLTILFSNCKKDRRGCLGGNATLTLIPKWEDTNNGGALSSVLGTTLYVWFDGTNAYGMFQPKDPSTADVVAIAGNNESTVKIQNLCRGKYGWRIFGKAPGMWKTYMAQGSSIIYWSERKKKLLLMLSFIKNNLNKCNALNLLSIRNKKPQLISWGFLIYFTSFNYFFLSKSTTIGVEIHNDE